MGSRGRWLLAIPHDSRKSLDSFPGMLAPDGFDFLWASARVAAFSGLKSTAGHLIPPVLRRRRSHGP